MSAQTTAGEVIVGEGAARLTPHPLRAAVLGGKSVV